MKHKKIERPFQIHFRLTEEEYKAILKKVEESGLSISEFSRRTLLGQTIVSAPPADYYLLLREVKRIGGNLNQLIRKLNVLGIAHSLELERFQNEMFEVVKMLYRTFRPGKEDNGTRTEREANHNE